jgi:hypothetical protein
MCRFGLRRAADLALNDGVLQRPGDPGSGQHTAPF